MNRFYTLKGSFTADKITYSLRANVFKGCIKSKYVSDSKFYYYRMWCRDRGYNKSLPALIEREDWEDNTKKYKVDHSDGTLDEIVIEKTSSGYFGKIIRTKPKQQYFGKNEGEKKVEVLKTDSELIGERAREITYLAFLPYNLNDLLFLIELHFGSRGMRTVRKFFEQCISQPYDIKAEPLKVRSKEVR